MCLFFLNYFTNTKDKYQEKKKKTLLNMKAENTHPMQRRWHYCEEEMFLYWCQLDKKQAVQWRNNGDRQYTQREQLIFEIGSIGGDN